MHKKECCYILDYAACDEIAAQIVSFCSGIHMENRDAVRYRLAAEECLLAWLSPGFEGAPVRLHMGRRMMSPYLVLEAEGEPFDPYREENGDFGPFCGSILSNLRLRPDYSYENGCNRLLFRIHRIRSFRRTENHLIFPLDLPIVILRLGNRSLILH